MSCETGKMSFHLIGNNGFHIKAEKRKIFCCWLILSLQQQIWKFHVVIWQTTLEKIKIFTSNEEKNNLIQMFCYYGVKVFNVA